MVAGYRRNRSVMDYSFAQIPTVDLPRSLFKRNCGMKTTFGCGTLIPIYMDEGLPGDTFSVRLSSVARMTTALVPFMDNLHMDFFFFAVPNRLLWENWKKFCGEQVDPGDSTDYTVPQVTAPSGGWTTGSLGDYLGIPIGVDPLPVNALHFRAYNLIYNEWFRDQNLQDSVTVNVDDGPDADTDYALLRRGKRHDYFTSCLPWPQKGDAVDLPLGTSADVKYGANIAGTSYNEKWAVFAAQATGDGHFRYGDTWATDTGAVVSGARGNLYADLSEATASTINSLREAFQLQKMLERDARGGTRYPEIQLKNGF